VDDVSCLGGHVGQRHTPAADVRVEPAAARMLFVARYFESAAADVEALPKSFWAR
jgi:hypothetical protein